MRREGAILLMPVIFCSTELFIRLLCLIAYLVNSISPGCRQKLRKLEVALIEYRESLEEHGVKNLEEIEKRVASHRKKLEAECGLVDAPTPSSRDRDRDSKGGDPGVDRRSSGASGNYVIFIPVG